MTRCTFAIDEQRSELVVCTRCGRRMWRVDGRPLDRYTAACQRRPRGDRTVVAARRFELCTHLGDEVLGSVKTGGCGGGWRSFYACAIHGLAIPTARCNTDGIRGCEGCGDYVPESNGPESNGAADADEHGQ